MSTNPIPFPLVGAQINLAWLNGAILQDVNTHWLTQASGPIGTLSAPVAEGDTTVTLVTPPLLGTASPAQQILCTPVANTVLIDNEPMIVTAQQGATLTVERAASAFPFMAALSAPPVTSHGKGAAVMLLTYSDPWTIIEDVLRNWAYGVAQSLGRNSATFGAVASGKIFLAQPA